MSTVRKQFCYSYSGNYGAIGMSASGERFWNRIGSSILERKVCTYAAYDGLKSLYGTFLGPDPEDVLLSDVYLTWGHDEVVSNTIAIKLINQARDRGTKLLAVNPQRTPLCSQADIYLQPRPSTDVQLCAGIMKYLVEKDLVNHKFIAEQTIGYDELLKRLDDISYDEIEAITGVPRAKMFEFAQVLGENEKKPCCVWVMASSATSTVPVCLAPSPCYWRSQAISVSAVTALSMTTFMPVVA